MGISNSSQNRTSPALFWAFMALTLLATSIPILTEPGGRGLAGNTLALCASVAAASVWLGAPLALAIARTDMFGRLPAAALLIALLFMPRCLQAAAWQAGFGLSGWYTSIS